MINKNTEKDKMHLEVISSQKKPYLLEINPLVWKCKFSPYLLSLYNRYSLFNKRNNTSKTKTKAEVSGGGKKPWRQKGTGRARQGSIRSPQWRGGGVVFGPTNHRNHSIEINKKVRKQALSSLLSKKLSEKKLLVIDKLFVPEYKTKNAVLFLKSFQLENKKILLVLSCLEELLDYIKKSFANLANVLVINSAQMNVSKLLSSSFVIITEKAFKEIENKLLTSSTKMNHQYV